MLRNLVVQISNRTYARVLPSFPPVGLAWSNSSIGGQIESEIFFWHFSCIGRNPSARACPYACASSRNVVPLQLLGNFDRVAGLRSFRRDPVNVDRLARTRALRQGTFNPLTRIRRDYNPKLLANAAHSV